MKDLNVLKELLVKTIGTTSNLRPNLRPKDRDYPK